MFFVILVDDVYCVAIHDLSPVLTALFFIELGAFNTDNSLFDTTNSTIKFLIIVSKTLQTVLVMLTGL